MGMRGLDGASLFLLYPQTIYSNKIKIHFYQILLSISLNCTIIFLYLQTNGVGGGGGGGTWGLKPLLIFG